MTQPETDPEAAQERQWRVRRQRRSTATIIVVLLALAGAFYYASTYFKDTAPTPSACTTEAPVSELKPQDVSVNVYNATTRPASPPPWPRTPGTAASRSRPSPTTR